MLLINSLTLLHRVNYNILNNFQEKVILSVRLFGYFGLFKKVINDIKTQKLTLETLNKFAHTSIKIMTLKKTDQSTQGDLSFFYKIYDGFMHQKLVV